MENSINKSKQRQLTEGLPFLRLFLPEGHFEDELKSERLLPVAESLNNLFFLFFAELSKVISDEGRTLGDYFLHPLP